jgi:hypothetical protein
VTLRIRDTATLRTATEARARKSDGTLAPIDRMMIRTAEGLTQFYRRGIRASVAPSFVNGYGTNKTGPVYTSSAAVSVDGGTQPYTYSWSVTGGIGVTNPNSPSTSFVGNPPGLYGELNGVGTCTITDASGLSQQVTVEVTITREGGF